MTTKRTSLWHAAASLFVMALLASVTAAATLTDYKQRLIEAREHLTALIVDVDESPSAADISEVSRLLPDSEKIELASAIIETQNHWLHAELGRLKAESNEKKRLDILIGIDERLAATLDAVETLERATAADRSKDEDKQKLAEILRREEYQKAQPKEESLFQKWWRQFMEWLEKQFPEPSISPEVTPAMGSIKAVLQVVVLVLVIALIGFILYKFAPALFSRFGSKSKDKREDRVILGERIDAHESARDLLAEAERLAGQGDLRGAIRKGYIAVLCDLSDRKVIALARHKTNRDYLRDVRRNETLFGSMTGLTGKFESSWYGLKPAGGNDWEEFREGCRRAVTEAGR